VAIPADPQPFVSQPRGPTPAQWWMAISSVVCTALVGTLLLMRGKGLESSFLAIMTFLSGPVPCFLVIVLLFAVALGIAAVLSALAQHRKVRGLTILALLSIGGAIAMLYRPAANTFLMMNYPIEAAVIPPEKARQSLDDTLSPFHVRYGSTRVLQAETYRYRTDDRHGCVYLFETEDVPPAVLKEKLLVIARATRGMHIDDADSSIRSLPYGPYPKWFDPKVYADADYLALDSYVFVFCPNERRVFFSSRYGD
jgi:hypothetical protein